MGPFGLLKDQTKFVFQNYVQKVRSITNPEDATSSRQNLKLYRIITKQSYKIKVMTQSNPRERINPVVHFVIRKKAATLVKKK